MCPFIKIFLILKFRNNVFLKNAENHTFFLFFIVKHQTISFRDICDQKKKKMLAEMDKHYLKKYNSETF